jgi:RNA polymerase sigma-70 factor (ECF subfamily)
VRGRTRSGEGKSVKAQGLPEEDAALIARVHAGDRDAFTELVTAHSSRLLTLAHAMLGARAEAEDVVQDVLLRVWMSRDTWTPGGPVRAYLAAAVRRRAVDVLRHRQVEARNAPGVILRQTLEVAADSNEDATLWAAVAALDLRWREAITLRYVNQLGYADVGRALGVSADAARMVVKRAVDALRERLAR